MQKVDLTTTNNTTVYTCPTATQTIVKSILVNDDNGKWFNIRKYYQKYQTFFHCLKPNLLHETILLNY